MIPCRYSIADPRKSISEVAVKGKCKKIFLTVVTTECVYSRLSSARMLR